MDNTGKSPKILHVQHRYVLKSKRLDMIFILFSLLLMLDFRIEPPSPIFNKNLCILAVQTFCTFSPPPPLLFPSALIRIFDCN